MVALRHTFTKNSSKNFETNLLELPMRRFSYRGSVPSNWASSPTSSFPSLSVSEVESWLKEIGTPNSVQANSLYLHCPLCKHPKDVWGQQLLKGTAWRNIACLNRTCRNSRTAAKWTCPCNKLWYLCAEHAPIGHLSGSAPRSKPEQGPKGGVKRTYHPRPLPPRMLACPQLSAVCCGRQHIETWSAQHRQYEQSRQTKKFMAFMYVDKVSTELGTSGMLVRFLGNLWSLATTYITIRDDKLRKKFIYKHSE